MLNTQLGACVYVRFFFSSVLRCSVLFQNLVFPEAPGAYRSEWTTALETMMRFYSFTTTRACGAACAARSPRVDLRR